MGDRESVVFLMPLAVHSAIAIETWQAVDQWDLQVHDGIIQAVRIGAGLGQPEYSQPYADLKTRITTAAAVDSFAGQRIANAAGLEDYYRTTGAYDDITPDDGSSETFTPAQPPPKLSCAGDSAVANPEDNRSLVHDCQALLAVKDVIRGSGSEVDPISWTGLRASQARVRVLLAMIPVLVPLNFSLPLIPLPEHRWPRGTSRPGSGSPGLDGVSGHCRTGSRLPLPFVPRWRWRRLSGTPPRTSASATTAPRKCCRCTGPSRPC